MAMRTERITAAPVAAESPKPQPPAQLGDFAILKRLAHDYLKHRWLSVSAAVACMIVTSGMTAMLAELTDPISKKIFLQHNNSMMVVATLVLAIVGVVAIRALSTFGNDYILNSIAERVVSEVQRDMFRSQIQLDLGAVNE